MNSPRRPLFSEIRYTRNAMVKWYHLIARYFYVQAMRQFKIKLTYEWLPYLQICPKCQKDIWNEAKGAKNGE